MSYFFMSNINNLNAINSPSQAYQEVSKGDKIEFKANNVSYSASFLMVRADYRNDILIKIHSNGLDYGVYIPAGELWSVDSLEGIDNFYITNIFNADPNAAGEELSTGYIQWMIGYK